MGFKCKLYEMSSDPRDKSAPKKWYGTTQSETPLSGKAMTKAATQNTTLAPIELEAALDLLGNFIPQQLLQGHTVTLPGLGSAAGAHRHAARAGLLPPHLQEQGGRHGAGVQREGDDLRRAPRLCAFQGAARPHPPEHRV